MIMSAFLRIEIKDGQRFDREGYFFPIGERPGASSSSGFT